MSQEEIEDEQANQNDLSEPSDTTENMDEGGDFH